MQVAERQKPNLILRDNQFMPGLGTCQLILTREGEILYSGENSAELTDQALGLIPGLNLNDILGSIDARWESLLPKDWSESSTTIFYLTLSITILLLTDYI